MVDQEPGHVLDPKFEDDLSAGASVTTPSPRGAWGQHLLQIILDEVTVGLPRPPVCGFSHIVEDLFARAAVIAAVLLLASSLLATAKAGPLRDVRLFTTLSFLFTSWERSRTVLVRHRPVNRDHLARVTITAQDTRCP